jgi:hypothetical protein
MCCSEEEHAGLLHRLETDECYYSLTDSVHVSYTATNVTGEPLHILFPDISCPLWIRVYEPQGGDVVWIRPVACFCEEGWGTLLPGESCTLCAVWDMRNAYTGQPIDEPGSYTVEGELAAADPAIWFRIALEIVIMDPPAGVADDQESPLGTWGAIKSLYR